MINRILIGIVETLVSVSNIKIEAILDCKTWAFDVSHRTTSPPTGFPSGVFAHNHGQLLVLERRPPHANSGELGTHDAPRQTLDGRWPPERRGKLKGHYGMARREQADGQTEPVNCFN